MAARMGVGVGGCWLKEGASPFRNLHRDSRLGRAGGGSSQANLSITVAWMVNAPQLHQYRTPLLIHSGCRFMFCFVGNQLFNALTHGRSQKPVTAAGTQPGSTGISVSDKCV